MKRQPGWFVRHQRLFGVLPLVLFLLVLVFGLLHIDFGDESTAAYGWLYLFFVMPGYILLTLASVIFNGIMLVTHWRPLTWQWGLGRRWVARLGPRDHSFAACRLDARHGHEPTMVLARPRLAQLSRAQSVASGHDPATSSRLVSWGIGAIRRGGCFCWRRDRSENGDRARRPHHVY